MQNKYLIQLLNLEEFIIEKIEYEAKQILVFCYPEVRGMWHLDQYSTALSTFKIKTARHMMIEDRVVILKIRQRKFHFNRYRKNLWEILPSFQRHKHDSQAFRGNTLRILRVTNYTGTSISRSTSKMYPLRLL